MSLGKALVDEPTGTPKDLNCALDLPIQGIRQDDSNDIGIGEIAYLRGQKMVVATLAHELAHIAGAAGSKSRAAENALIHCRLGKHSEAKTGAEAVGLTSDPPFPALLSFPVALECREPTQPRFGYSNNAELLLKRSGTNGN